MFDKYLDGDPYGDEAYIRNFRLILGAIKSKTALGIETVNRKGTVTYRTLMPEYLEYSEKDDKFRLIGSGCRYGGVVNLGRIVNCKMKMGPFKHQPNKKYLLDHRTIELELLDERNALERVLMHFAHFEKQAEKLEPGRYKIAIRYNKEDETEMVIRILSFGPVLRVLEPEAFLALIRERLRKQLRIENF